MAQAPINVDLILRGRLARRTVTFVGSFADGALSEFSGCVTLNAKLAALLGDLGAGYGEAGSVLRQLLGDDDIVIDKLGGAYRKGRSGQQGERRGSVQAGLVLKFDAGSVQFAVVKGLGSQKGFIAGVDVRVPKKVPNNFLSGLLGDLTIGSLGVYYSSEAFPEVAFFDAERFQDARGFKPPALPATTLAFPQGVKVTAEILVGGINLLEQLSRAAPPATPPESPPQAPPAESEACKAKQTLAKGSTFWFEANKVIGPLTIRRVGLSYEAPRLGIKLDAGLQLSVLSLALEGLGLSYPIDGFSSRPKEIWDRLKFHLDGASVAFSTGPLTIGGGLIKVNNPQFPDRLQLDGFLLIRAQILTISALGSYADLNGTPSLFVFAALQRALGGPAFFFITGLAVGFGVNRALKLPDIREVHNFPLIRAATDPDYLAKNPDLRAISQRLNEYVYPLQGDFWVAAGIKFLSFGQIESFAMVSVSFGTQLEIALLGLSRIRVPKLPAGVPEDSVPAIAFAEMAFKVSVAPASGLLSFEARLTENSFVLRRDFKLRGGFAFYAWFAGAHEGDFVVSIGGYHPRFKAPAHYPKPDLVEFACNIGDTVTIRGYCYFALCPSAIMAGGGLNLVFQQGGIRAWFIAQADFLVQWKPLYYEIAISVSIGVSLRITIGIIRISLSMELGAALQLHGPPLGGFARVSLYIVTIEIAFGEAKRLPPPLLWESSDADKSFAKAFLPNPKVTALSITDGLLAEAKNEKGETTFSFVAPQKLTISARTLVPATAVRFNGASPKGCDGREVAVPLPKVNGRATVLGVRSMDKASFYSRIDISLLPVDDASEEASAYLNQYLEISLVTKSVPLALWGKPIAEADKSKPPAAAEQMADDALVGIEIKTKAGPRPWETPALDLNVLAYERDSKSFDWIMPAPADALPGFGEKTIANTVKAQDVIELRRAIVAKLIATGRRVMAADASGLAGLAAGAAYVFQAMPAMARVGQYPPRGYLNT
jgi:hypothetical protein